MAWNVFSSRISNKIQVLSQIKEEPANICKNYFIETDFVEAPSWIGYACSTCKSLLALVGNAINFDTQKFVILTTAVNFDNLELMNITEKKSSNPNNILR